MQTRLRTWIGVLAAACACLWATPARAQLTLRCDWGGTAPSAVFPTSRQVMMTPLVMDFVALPGGSREAAFVSFSTAADANRDGGGVLRIIDQKCQELARFPDPLNPLTAPNCPANFATVPHLALTALAAGDLDGNPGIEIVGLLDHSGTTPEHYQLVAFTVTGTQIIPLWCSVPLPATDAIPGSTAPAIAQLDAAGSAFAPQSEIIVDNKVFDANGVLRFSGGPGGPHSRTVAVARVVAGTSLPQVITGSGLYRSSASPLWTGQLVWTAPWVTASTSALVFPAVAELDPAHPGPEIIVSDLWNTTLRVLSSAGVQLAAAAIPNPNPPSNYNTRCGGPPMVGNAHPAPGPEIGVASCTAYTLFSYAPAGPALNVLWSAPTHDQGGQTTSTLIDAPGGGRVVYADRNALWVFNGATGGLIQPAIAHSSATAIEGPAFAAMDGNAAGPPWRCGQGRGLLVVGANNHAGGSVRGIRIFEHLPVVVASNCWNQHGFHVTNVVNGLGAIPTSESPSWLPPARNTYRVP